MKKVLVGFVTVLLVGIMVGCSNSMTKLPDWISEEDMTAKCNEVISLLNAKEYEKVIAMGRDDFKAQITTDALAQTFDEILAKAGEFVQVKKVTVGGTKEENGNPIAVAALECKYQNTDHVYNISFDKDMTLIGLFVK